MAALGINGLPGTSGANLPDLGENGFCVDRGEVVGDLGPAAGAALFELESEPRSESEDGDGDKDIWMGRLPVFTVSSYSSPRPSGKESCSAVEVHANDSSRVDVYKLWCSCLEDHIRTKPFLGCQRRYRLSGSRDNNKPPNLDAWEPNVCSRYQRVATPHTRTMVLGMW